jgi:hypothetical protein
MQGAAEDVYELSKGQWASGRKKGHTNKSLSKRPPKPTAAGPVLVPAAVEPEADASPTPSKPTGKEWTVVQKGKRKQPRVQKGYTLDSTTAADKFLGPDKQNYTGEPCARQNRNEFVMRSQLQERSLTDDKLLYVSKYNKQSEKRLQRR